VGARAQSERPPSAAPGTPQLGDGATMLEVVCGQRDRFRARIAELETVRR
jgi:hypothetical protein